MEKRGDEESTWVEVFSLSAEERVKELARMMGDEGRDDSALQYAEALMKRARECKYLKTAVFLSQEMEDKEIFVLASRS